MFKPSYIPVEENPLFLQNFTNGTGTQVAYPTFFDAPSHVNLSILPNNLASLAFNATDPNLSYAIPLLLLILNGDALRMPIICIYPLSGSYDTLSRVLFYVLMAFSFIFRRYKRISLAALGTAMTYGAYIFMYSELSQDPSRDCALIRNNF